MIASINPDPNRWSKLRLILLITSLVFGVLGECSATKSGDSRNNPLRKPKFISFNPVDDQVKVDLDLSIPFLSIPLTTGSPSLGSLINVNPKALIVAAVFTIVSTLIIPLLLGNKKNPHYRSEEFEDVSSLPDVMNEVFLRNSYIAPCTKKFICSVVSQASRAQDKTNFDKIIDGISNHEWFDRMVQGTPIEEAIAAGRRTGSNCNEMYSECVLVKKSVDSYSHPMMKSDFIPGFPLHLDRLS